MGIVIKVIIKTIIMEKAMGKIMDIRKAIDVDYEKAMIYYF